MAEWASLTGRALRPDRDLPDRGCERDPRRDGHDRRHGHGGGRSPPGPGPAGRLRRRDELPAVPGAALAQALAGRPGRRRRGADRRARSPPTTRSRVRSRPRCSTRRPRACGAARALVVAGLGSRDVGAGDLVAVFDWLAERPRRAIGVRGPRHPAPARRSTATPSTSGPPARISVRGHSIGGFGSRHHQQAGGHRSSGSCSACRSRRIRATDRRRRGCPTTYYLTVRRSADPPARASSTGSTSCRSTTSRRSGRATRSRVWSTAGRCSSSRRSPSAEAIWAAIPATARGGDPGAAHPRWRRSTPRPSRAGTRRGRTS